MFVSVDTDDRLQFGATSYFDSNSQYQLNLQSNWFPNIDPPLTLTTSSFLIFGKDDFSEYPGCDCYVTKVRVYVGAHFPSFVPMFAEDVSSKFSLCIKTEC